MMDQQDRIRYWTFTEIQASAEHFAGPAVTAFARRFGHLTGDDDAFTGLGSTFRIAGAHLATPMDALDKTRNAREATTQERQQARRQCNNARKAMRREILSSRQFADSQTQGKGDGVLGVKGFTPRESEPLAEWGIQIHRALLRAPWTSPAARALSITQAESLATAHRQFVDAVMAVERAKAREASAKAALKQARERFDAESAKVIRFLRSSLELAGEDYLSHRVLGKRRGRPRKSETARRKSEAETKESPAAGRESDSAPLSASTVARKSDAATSPGAPPARSAGEKPGHGDVQAGMEPWEIDEISSEAGTSLSESETTLCRACTAPEKIVETPCKPCTEPPVEEQVYYFQPDTSRTGRRRRRRGVSSFLGASARLLSSGWVGRFVSEGRWRKRWRSSELDSSHFQYFF